MSENTIVISRGFVPSAREAYTPWQESSLGCRLQSFRRWLSIHSTWLRIPGNDNDSLVRSLSVRQFPALCDCRRGSCHCHHNFRGPPSAASVPALSRDQSRTGGILCPMRNETPRTISPPANARRVPVHTIGNTSKRQKTQKVDSKESNAAPRRGAIRRRLLRWFDQHRRDLPWRRRQEDPYAQWVAEIMLQQTRVETVLGYYDRFLQRFPNVRTLADADHQAMLKLWEGLGYYRRAMHLHAAARLVRDAGGTMPSSAVGLRALPGVGEYTAAAIASIAYGEAVAAVDGNVVRVLSRLFAITENTRAGATSKRISRMAQELLSPKRPGDFNQAWMDLGSAICTPKTPRCPQCPLRALCRASALGLADTLPVTSAKSPPREQHLVTAIIMSDRRMLLHRRPTGGLWSGLWEFPTMETNDQGSAMDKPQRLRSRCRRGKKTESNGAKEKQIEDFLASESLVCVDRPRQIAVVGHQLTHRSLHFHVYGVSVEKLKRVRAMDDKRWVTRKMFADLPVSTAHRRVYEAMITSTDDDD